MKIPKEIKIYIIAVIIVLASSPLIYLLIQNQMISPQSTSVDFLGHHEEQRDYIRFWTDTQPNSWSGMETARKWSFTNSLTMKAQVKVTSTGSPTLYTEVILVDVGDVDEGFGFQITNSSQGQVRIKGWSWVEEAQSFTSYIDRDTNVIINLEARKIGTSQIDFYVDNSLIGSTLKSVPSQEGVLNLDMTNGSQGGFSELLFYRNYQIQETT